MASENPLVSAISKESRLPLWMTHLWQRLHEHSRLGLVLGAGVSYDAKIPLWPELVKRLATAAGITQERLALHQKERFPETFLAEILLRKHNSDEAKAAAKHSFDRHHDHRVNASWKQKIRECIYKDIADKSFEDVAKGHTYLRASRHLCAKLVFP
jgi:hypothetical protein